MATLAAGAFKPHSQAFSKLQFVSGGWGAAACTDLLSQPGSGCFCGSHWLAGRWTVPAELCHGSRLCWRTESAGLSEVSAHVMLESPSMHLFLCTGTGPAGVSQDDFHRFRARIRKVRLLARKPLLLQRALCFMVCAPMVFSFRCSFPDPYRSQKDFRFTDEPSAALKVSLLGHQTSER